jgi:hypothetical protein
MPPTLPSTISAVIDQLGEVVDEAIVRRDRIGYFAAMYRRVTAAIKDAIDADVFDDGPRMSVFDAAFGCRYLEAYNALRAGNKPSRCWRVSFDADRENDHLIVQHMLLGINAHINLDLAAAAASAAPGKEIGELRPDFNRVNDILTSVLADAQDIVGGFSPLLSMLDDVGGRTDEEILGFSIVEMRRQAWDHAVVLARQPDDDDRALLDIIDRKVAFLGRVVRDPGFPLSSAIRVIRHFEHDDVAEVIRALNPAI